MAMVLTVVGLCVAAMGWQSLRYAPRQTRSSEHRSQLTRVYASLFHHALV